MNEFLDALTLARWQFGLTTLYHFLFVPLTIGLSFLVAILQTAWVRTGKVADLVLGPDRIRGETRDDRGQAQHFLTLRVEDPELVQSVINLSVRYGIITPYTSFLIEEDDMFRQHVKSLIEGQVRHVLREQLSGIVAGEIAKLRLLQPNSPTLGDLIAAELKKQTSQKVTPSAIATELQKQVKAEVDKAIKPLAQQVKDALSEAIAAKIRA